MCVLVAEKLELPLQSSVPVNICFLSTTNYIAVNIVDDEYLVRALYFILPFSPVVDESQNTKNLFSCSCSIFSSLQ